MVKHGQDIIDGTYSLYNIPLCFGDIYFVRNLYTVTFVVVKQYSGSLLGVEYSIKLGTYCCLNIEMHQEKYWILPLTLAMN